MINDVEVLGTFGKSDHNMLRWRSNITVESGIQMRTLLDYNRADITSIRQELKNTDWDSMLQRNTDECWTKLEETFVPTKKVKDCRYKKASWLTYKAVKFVKRKHRLFAKYKSNDHPAYRIAAKNADIEVRRAKLNFGKKLS